jgi:6-phosphogluconate dehydrogenase
LATVARIWRGGCIIRAALLDTIRAAFQQQHDLPNLLLDTVLANRLAGPQVDLRAITCAAGRLGVPVPAHMACLGYYDSYRSARLPTNLIQAQRDFFGAHTYERTDEKGTFHTDW